MLASIIRREVTPIGAAGLADGMDAAAGKMWERRTAIVTMPTVEIVVIRALRWTIDAVVTVGTMHTQEAMVGIYIFTLREV